MPNYSEEISTRIEIIPPLCEIRVREETQMIKDGAPVGQPSYHRRVIMPNDDISKESEQIKSTCAIWHTDDVKETHTKVLAAARLKAEQKKKKPEAKKPE